MKNFKFTQEVKDNWIKALESGKYEQFGYKLKNPVIPNQMCCLGVLADILNIKIDSTGYRCLSDNFSEIGYEPFNDMKIHEGCNLNLATINDKSYSEGIRDYSNVIPLIKELPIQE